MRWHGSKPLVIGTVSEDGTIEDEFIVGPGEIIPEMALKLIREREAIDVPYVGQYSRKLVKEAALKSVKN